MQRKKNISTTMFLITSLITIYLLTCLTNQASAEERLQWLVTILNENPDTALIGKVIVAFCFEHKDLIEPGFSLLSNTSRNFTITKNNTGKCKDNVGGFAFTVAVKQNPEKYCLVDLYMKQFEKQNWMCMCKLFGCSLPSFKVIFIKKGWFKCTAPMVHMYITHGYNLSNGMVTKEKDGIRIDNYMHSKLTLGKSG